MQNTYMYNVHTCIDMSVRMYVHMYVYLKKCITLKKLNNFAVFGKRTAFFKPVSSLLLMIFPRK